MLHSVIYKTERGSAGCQGDFDSQIALRVRRAQRLSFSKSSYRNMLPGAGAAALGSVKPGSLKVSDEQRKTYKLQAAEPVRS